MKVTRAVSKKSLVRQLRRATKKSAMNGGGDRKRLRTGANSAVAVPTNIAAGGAGGSEVRTAAVAPPSVCRGTGGKECT